MLGLCRGSPCSIPEETVESFQAAAAAGADYLEMDVVRISSDPDRNAACMPEGAEIQQDFRTCILVAKACWSCNQRESQHQRYMLSPVIHVASFFKREAGPWGAE